MTSVPAQQERARRHHVAAGHERELRARHLIHRRAADLARGLDDEVDAVDVGLREAAAPVVVGRRPPTSSPWSATKSPASPGRQKPYSSREASTSGLKAS